MITDKTIIADFLAFITANHRHTIFDKELLFSGTLNSPAANDILDAFEDKSPQEQAIKALYGQCNGLCYTSFSPNHPEREVGFYFAPVESFVNEKVELANWGFSWGVPPEDCEVNDPNRVFDEAFDHVLNGDEGIFEGYGGFSSVIVFGGIVYSPNKLFLVTQGQYVGSVIYFEHDGGEFIELATSFSMFLQNLTGTKMDQFVGRFL